MKPAATAGLGTGVALSLPPSPAAAHAMLDGAGDFYSGLLHPLVVPAEALALAAVALLLGVSGRAACRTGLAALAAGLAAGLLLGRHLPPPFITPALLATALAAAGPVAAGLQAPPLAAALVAAFAGLAVGADAQPDPAGLPQALTAGGATLLGATALTAIAAAAALGCADSWRRIAVRVVASWIAACAILYFAWLATHAGP